MHRLVEIFLVFVLAALFTTVNCEENSEIQDYPDIKDIVVLANGTMPGALTSDEIGGIIAAAVVGGFFILWCIIGTLIGITTGNWICLCLCCYCFCRNMVVTKGSAGGGYQALS